MCGVDDFGVDRGQRYTCQSREHRGGIYAVIRRRQANSSDAQGGTATVQIGYEIGSQRTQSWETVHHPPDPDNRQSPRAASGCHH